MGNTKVRHIHLAETESTNAYAKSITIESPYTLISADHQTSGRGQRGNSWESAPGENLLFSLCLTPKEIPASQQFILCELISVAISEVLKSYTTDISIKWPNDIYYRDQKLCGILIEHEIESTTLSRSIIGVGLNVNQTKFISNASNPVSLCQILGHEVEREALLQRIIACFITLYEQYILLLSEDSNRYELHQRYTQSLYRKGIQSVYRDAHAEFIATLLDVELDGRLILKDQLGILHSYLFKEVTYII